MGGLILPDLAPLAVGKPDQALVAAACCSWQPIIRLGSTSSGTNDRHDLHTHPLLSIF